MILKIKKRKGELYELEKKEKVDNQCVVGCYALLGKYRYDAFG